MTEERPTKIGYQMKKGLPFISGDDNEVFCGGNFGVLIKCYYYGSEEGVITDDVLMTYETYNWFVVDFTDLWESDGIILAADNPISVSIPVRTDFDSF